MPRRKKPKIEEQKTLRLPAENPQAKLWLWIGVSAVSAIILVLWGWATSISLSSFSWAKTSEKKLIDNSKENWNMLFNNEKTKIQNEQLKLQIKKLINTVETEINAASSTTSTIAIENVSSTTVSSTR